MKYTVKCKDGYTHWQKWRTEWRAHIARVRFDYTCCGDSHTVVVEVDE